MANSSDVVVGADAKASEYNNLRKDVIDTTTGHTHNGSDSSLLGDGCSFKNNQTRYLSIPPCSFIPQDGNVPYYLVDTYIRCGALTASFFYCPVNLPQEATISKVTAYWYRDDFDAGGWLSLYKISLPDITPEIVGTMHSNSFAGKHTVVNSAISDPLVASSYWVFYLILDPNDSMIDVYLNGIVIEYTIKQIG